MSLQLTGVEKFNFFTIKSIHDLSKVLTGKQSFQWTTSISHAHTHAHTRADSVYTLMLTQTNSSHPHLISFISYEEVRSLQKEKKLSNWVSALALLNPAEQHFTGTLHHFIWYRQSAIYQQSRWCDSVGIVITEAPFLQTGAHSPLQSCLQSKDHRKQAWAAVARSHGYSTSWSMHSSFLGCWFLSHCILDTDLLLYTE